MRPVHLINKVLHNMGAQIIRYPSRDLLRRLKLIEHFKINKILDVGASTGGYAMYMRKLQFKGTIISFEPLSHAFQQLQNHAKNNDNWIVQNCALGDEEQETLINVSSNSDSSSILGILPDHVKSEPNSKVIKKEKIIVKKLDSVFPQFYNENDRFLLKIDTQGFEKQVLDGAEQSLEKMVGVQVEMSLVPLYQNSVLFPELREYMYNKGFSLFSIENGFSDPNTGRLLQVDGLFFKES